MPPQLLRHKTKFGAKRPSLKSASYPELEARHTHNRGDQPSSSYASALLMALTNLTCTVRNSVCVQKMSRTAFYINFRSIITASPAQTDLQMLDYTFADTTW